MKYALMQSELRKALQVVATVVPSKSTLPILETVLMEVTREGQLTLTATDLDISVRTRAKVKATEGGKVAVAARRLFDVVRELPEQEIEVSGDAAQIELTCARGRYRFVGASVDDFPELPDIADEKHVGLDPAMLETMIRRTLYAVSTDETRPELTGVFLEIKEGSLRMVATNGHRLSRAAVRRSFKQERDMLLPPKALNQILRLTPGQEAEVEVTGTKSYARFRIGDTDLYSRLLEGPFPDYERVIPKSSPLKATIKREDVIASLRRILVLSDSQTRQIKMVFEPQRLQIQAEYQGAGEATEEIPVKYDGESIAIGFNGGYLLEMLKTFGDEDVVMSFESAVSAGVFRPATDRDDEELLCLVMPLRLPEGS